MHLKGNISMALSVQASIHPSITLSKFLHICRQTTNHIELKFGRQTRYGNPQVWLTFGHTPLNFYHFLACDQTVSAHLQTNCWSDCAQIWCAYLSWDYPGLINFCLIKVEQRPIYLLLMVHRRKHFVLWQLILQTENCQHVQILRFDKEFCIIDGEWCIYASIT